MRRKRFGSEYFGMLSQVPTIVVGNFYRCFEREYHYILIYHFVVGLYQISLLPGVRLVFDYIGPPWIRCVDGLG